MLEKENYWTSSEDKKQKLQALNNTCNAPDYRNT
jgi:hypothetical protein